MATVTNTTDRELLALAVEGVDYYSAPGDSLEVEPRTALLLREAGWTMTPEQQRSAIAADDHPTAQPLTEDETRFTGGRHHRSDDPRANVPGTPVEVTGDTGSPLNQAALPAAAHDDAAAPLAGMVDDPDVPLVPAARGRRRGKQQASSVPVSVEAGNDLTVKLTPQAADAEPVEDVVPVGVQETGVGSGRPLVTSETNPAAEPVAPEQAAAQPPVEPGPQVDHTVATGEAQQELQGGAVPPSLDAATPPVGTPEYDERTTEMLDAISNLRGAALDEAMDRAGLSPLQKTRDQKHEELRAKLLADRQG